METKETNIAKLSSAFKQGETVTGTIIEAIPAGWTVEICGEKAFLPRSQFKNDNKPLPESFTGRKISCKIIEFETKGALSGLVVQKFIVSYFRNQFFNVKQGDIVRGRVVFANQSGISICARGVNVWIPKEELPTSEMEDIKTLYPRGTQIAGEIKSIDFRKGKVIISVNDYQRRIDKLFNSFEIGKIYSGSICRIESYCASVDLGGIEGVIAIKDIANQFVADIHSFINIGDRVSCVVLSKTASTHKISLGLKQVAEIQEQETRNLVKKLASALNPGDIFEATVSSIDASGIHIILGGNIPGLIPKPEVRWGFSDIMTEAFVGEKRNVVFLREDDGLLICSARYLEEDKYSPELYDLNTEELLSNLGIEKNIFVGKVIRGSNNVMMFVNLYAASDNDDGKVLIDPISGVPIKVLIPVRVHNLFDEGSYYKLSLTAADSNLRKKERTPYRFIISNEKALESSKAKVDDPYRKLVDRSFFKHNSPSSNANQAKLLEEVGQNMYDSKDRMFFELLQNADDASAKNGVKIILQSVDGFLLLSHNGMPFDRKDYVSITSAARSTKSGKKAKTGYKGIGFKSVFTNSTKVYIKSGGFFFVFDKEDTIFSDFDNFYFKVNKITSPELQKEYLKDNKEEKDEFNGVDSIPWQLLPFWSDSIPSKLNKTIFSHNSNVCIALAMSDTNRKEYIEAILDVLNDPKFMLFLRNTNRIQYKEKNVEFNLAKRIINGKTILQSTLPEHKIVKRYLVKDGSMVDISDVEFAAIGVDIKIRKITNKNIGKEESIFVDSHNQKIPSIPSRIAESSNTQISYAISLNDQDIIEPLQVRHSLYAYLPMVETRFPFPIYINADFILKSNRQGIQSDNVWNHFLMYHIGRNYVRWIGKEASKLQPNYLALLLRSYFDESDKDMKDLASFFNKGYKEGLCNERFILNDKDDIVGQDDIILDETGLSPIIGAENFCKLVGQETKHLPHTNLDSFILSLPIFDRIEHINSKTVNEHLLNKINLKYIRKWLSEADESQQKLAYNWLINKNDPDLVKHLPLFKFKDGRFRSIEDIEDTTHFMFLDSSFAGITDILSKLGIICTDYAIQSHPLYQKFLKDGLLARNLSKVVTIIITLSQKYEERLLAQDKVILYQLVESKCQSDKLASLCAKWKLFRNSEGSTCELGKMMESGSDSDENNLFSSSIISLEEYKLMPNSLRARLMSRDKIYTSSIIHDWNTLIDKWMNLGNNSGWTEKQYARIYEIVARHYKAYCSNNPNVRVQTISTTGGVKYILCESDFFKKEDVMYSPKFSDATLRSAAKKMLDISIPSESALPYLAKEPFITAAKKLLTQKQRPNITLSEIELTRVLQFCKDGGESFFQNYVVTPSENEYIVSNNSGKWQFFSEEQKVIDFVQINCLDSISLPISFKDFKNNDGIISGEDLFDKIFKNVNCIEQGNLLLSIVNTQSDKIKKKYICAVGDIHLTSKSFAPDGYYASLFKLCSSLFSADNDNPNERLVYPDRTAVYIDYTDENSVTESKQLKDIPLQGKVSVGDYCFDMDDLNPGGLQSFQISARGVLAEMRKSGVNETYLDALFDLNSTIDAKGVYNSLNTPTALKNGSQLAFVLHYIDCHQDTSLKFKIKATDGKEYDANCHKEWYVNSYSFIESSRVLNKAYSDISEYLSAKDDRKRLGGFDFFENADSLKHIKTSLSAEETSFLLQYIYEKWSNEKNYWNGNAEIGSLLAILNINKDVVVISEDYSLKDECLPDNVSKWVSEGKDCSEIISRQDFLQIVFSLNGDSSDVVAVRKYLTGGGAFSNDAKASLSTLFQDKTCKWIESKNITLSELQYETLKDLLDGNHIVDSVNMSIVNSQVNRLKPSIIINSYEVYEYDGIIPRHVCLRSDTGYEIYTYEDGDCCIDRNKIIISSNSWSSLESILMRIASDSQSGFSSKDFLTYMQNRGVNSTNDETDYKELQAKCQAMENELRRLKEAMNRSNVDMSSIDDSYTGLDPERQGEYLREARRAVREYLRDHEGFYVPDEVENPSDWTKIKGVKKGNEEYTVIVRSYRDSESRNFELNTYDWISLMEGNSMLWVYTKRGVECFPFRDLVRNKNRISLSFSTVNTDYPKRMTALAESLRYFKGIRFDFGPNLSRGHSTAERFIKPEKKLDEALKDDDIEGMF